MAKNRSAQHASASDLAGLRIALMVRLFLASVVFICATCAATAQTPDAQPVNPDATPAARALLHDLDTISGHATIAGQHNYPNTVSRYSDRVYDLTGEYPGIFGQDFGFSGGDDKDSALGRPSMIEEVIRQYRNGAVIALTWHSVRPTEDEPVTFRDSVQGHLTDWEWRQLLTPGTALNMRWRRQVDRIAGYLKELEDAGVPVLFRPYHEMNGKWFWWGGRPGPDGSAALYRQLYDRYVHVHHLNNLVWVWNVNSPSASAGPVADYFPGSAYADVLTMDIYEPFRQELYDQMVALADPLHKPIALAEVAAMPSLATLAAQPRWAYFMMWSGLAEGSNSLDQLQTVFHAPNIVNRGDSRLSAPLVAPTTPPAPGDIHASAEVRALLDKLADAKGKGVLAGQSVVESAATTFPAATPFPPATPFPEIQAVLAATGKQPAIVEIDLTGATDPAMLLAQVREATRQGELVAIRFAPPRPTDGAATGVLTSFEWQQLLEPGTDLNHRWAAQADAAAALLRPLAEAHLAVLFGPYPALNADGNWWSCHPGPEGSQELYLRLYERLTGEANLHNLAWVWEAAPPSFNPGANNGPGGSPGGNYSLDEFFPGPLYIDAITLDADTLGASRFPLDRLVSQFVGDKPFGVRIASGVPATDVLAREVNWRWMLLSPAAVSGSAAVVSGPDAIKAFYTDPHVLAAPQK
jgi:mannan endo-1,4-beta-mannosidase